MANLIEKFKSIENRIIMFGKLSTFKHLFYFLFYICVSYIFESWFLIAIAIYSLCICIVKANCIRGLSKNQDQTKDCKSYIRGGIILTSSSMFYLIFTVYQTFYPSSFQFSFVVALAIALYAAYNILVSVWGLIRSKGRTLLVKEYKLTNFALAFNNMLIAQIAISSFIASSNSAFYNIFLGIICGTITLIIGMYLIIDGAFKKYKIKNRFKNRF